jgi:hypothetical protein
MSKERDPLGKRALFSGAGTKDAGSTPAAVPKRRRGPLDVTVTCSSCDTATTLSAPEIAFKHLPVVAWLPWRKQSLLMRCPACNRLAWHAVSRPT